MIRAALGLSIVMIVATYAAADPAAADKLAATATDLVAKGQFKAAAAKFAEAYKEDPSRPEFFCNIGISYYKAQELPRAHLLLSQCLTRTALEQGFVDLARAVLKQVEDTLRTSGHAPVTINVTPPATSVVIEELGAESVFLGSRTVWLAFGTHHAVGSAEGHVTKRAEIVAVDQRPLTVELKLDRAEAALPLPPLKPRPAPHRVSKVPAILASVVTALAIGVAVIAFGKAHEAADDAAFAFDAQAFEDDKSAVSTWNTVMGATGTIAIAGVVASTYLWVKATRTTRVEVRPTTTGAALVFGGRF